MQLTDTRPTGEREVESGITRVSASSIRPGMDVSSFGGDPLGRVKAVEKDHVVVMRPWLRDARVPLERVLAVGRDSLILTRLRQLRSTPSPTSRPARRIWSLLTRSHSRT
jgi:hypothetical protein